MNDRPVELSITVDGDAALHSGPGRTARLRIHNTGEFGITIDPHPGAAGPENHHVALFLPAGTLSDASLADLAVSDGWALGRGDRRSGENHWDGIYLADQVGRSIPPGAEAVVLLHGVAADPRGAARHARVVVEYGLLNDGPMVGSALRGTRSLMLAVVPWAHSPTDLHVDAAVISGASVVNRAAVANRIVVGLSATVVDGVVRFIGGRTELIVSWDIGPADARWWALCDGAEAEACEVAVQWVRGDPESTRDDVDQQVRVSQTAATWRIIVPEDLAFREGEGIALVIDGLVTSHPSGPANLYLTVAGADGSGTGVFVLKVAKQPSIWAGPGGLTLYAGHGDDLVMVRGAFGQPAALLSRSPTGAGEARRGQRLDLYTDDGTRVGARLSAAERSRVEHGLDVGGGLRLPGAGGVALRGENGTLSITSDGGALEFVPPAGAGTYTVEAGAGSLLFHGSTVTTGSVLATGSLTAGGDAAVGGSLTVSGPVELHGEVRAHSLQVSQGDLPLLAGLSDQWPALSAPSGLAVTGPLRLDGSPLLALQTFRYRYGANPTGRGSEWTPLIIGDRDITLVVEAPLVRLTITGKLTLAVRDGQWHIEPEETANVPDLPPESFSGQAELTVLFVCNALFR